MAIPRCSRCGRTASWGTRCRIRCTAYTAPKRRSRSSGSAIRSRRWPTSSSATGCSTRPGSTRSTPKCGRRSRRRCSSPTRAPTPSRARCSPTCSPSDAMPVLTYRDALNQALREEMQRNADVFLMGEEVGVYQGAYKVSRGLLEEFGPKRVVDTPIAELGFAGIGVGAAMAGLRPVVEFMTWNFALLALDQIINSAAKMLYMSGGQLKMPIVFRGPNGAALQLGSQHSQAWESWLAHMPGLKVVAPATPADAKGLLKAAIRDDNPVIVLEGEMLYNTKGEVPEGEHVVPIGRAEVKRAGSDVTLICHSKTVTVALKAAEQLQEQNVSAEVLDLRSLRPMDEPAILESIAKTNRAVVVEEGWPHCGVGAQVVDIIQRDAFDQLDAPVQRVTQADAPMPYNKHLERAAKASPEKVVAAARRVLYLD
ncbi:MAG: pyruvate dehydrogenase complex E1 component subunit beta [Gemmatimonadetes bacterium]|nr:MAG: pyruvate dehydrogenase complex E1 component subunit beta [Gemmatimonadota bacterium]